MASVRPLPRRGSSVASLLASGRPSAVGGRVVAVVVDALNGEFGVISVRKRPVSERDVIGPLFTDLDSTGSIPDPVFGIGVSAPLGHAFPNSIELSPIRFSMLHAGCGRSFTLNAATRRCISRTKVLVEDRFSVVATGALAIHQPPVAAVLADYTGDAELSVPLTHCRHKGWIPSHSAPLSKSIKEGA